MTHQNESAGALLQRMLEVYATANCYADTGAVIRPGMPLVVFQTAFVRGRQFRFEFREDQDAYVIWSDGVHTYKHWPRAMRIGRAEMLDYRANIALAIAAATGVSARAAHTVPAMLLPVSIGPGILAELGDLLVERNESIEGRPCMRVSGCTPTKEPTTLWIDCETYVLRRMWVRHVVQGRMHFEMTATYQPSLSPIDASSITRPDIEKTPPQPAGPTPWTGIRIATGSTRINMIEKGSPAERSLLAIGDEVEAANGQATDRFGDVFRALYTTTIGEDVALRIRRGSTTLEVVVRVEAAPSQPRMAPAGPLLE